MTHQRVPSESGRVPGLCIGLWARSLWLGALWIVFMLLAAGPSTAASVDEEPYASRKLVAARLAAPPVIDGDVADPTWVDAAVGETFVDPRTGKVVDDQTRFWLGYDDESIYVAFQCFDPEPEDLVMRETKRDGDIERDDRVGVELDAFHTHNWDDLAIFEITPRGTLSSRVNSGRSGKTEWKGEWQGAARVVADGWTAEISIPWGILAHPSGDGPATVGFNVARHHGHSKLNSMYSNVGAAFRWEHSADWVGVELPEGGFTPELLVLPFAAAGTAERDDAWEGTARGGLDLRYRPTSMLSTVVTFNPDFRNVQGEVEGIDFTRGERQIDETRPFFQEGNNIFSPWNTALGPYFYSRRIEHVDLGGKVYGKLWKRTNVGLLGTFDFADQLATRDPWELHRHDYVGTVSQGLGESGTTSVMAVSRRGDQLRNTVIGGQAGILLLRKRLSLNAHYGSSRFHGVDEATDGDDDAGVAEPPPLEAVSLSGDLGRLGVGWWDGKVWMDMNWHYLAPGFRARDGRIEFPGRRGVEFWGGYWSQGRDSYFTEVSLELNSSYEERYSAGAGYDDAAGLFERAFSTVGDRVSNRRFFRDHIGYWTRWGTRTNLSFGSSGRIGHWRDEGSVDDDLDWSLSYNVGAQNGTRTRGGRLEYSFGEDDGTFRHFISYGGTLQHRAVSVNYNGSILRHVERRQQHVLGVNYDLSTTMTMGGRLVFEYDEIAERSTWNPYVSFRRSGEAGVETFLILGDPSGGRFVPRLEGKVLLPF